MSAARMERAVGRASTLADLTLRPATNTLRRLSFTSKVAAIAALLSLPIGLLLSTLQIASNNEIRFASLELEGSDVLGALGGLEHDLGNARLDLASGTRTRAATSTVAQTSAAVARATSTETIGGVWIKLLPAINRLNADLKNQTATSPEVAAVQASLSSMRTWLTSDTGVLMDPAADSHAVLDSIWFRLPTMSNAVTSGIDTVLSARRAGKRPDARSTWIAAQTLRDQAGQLLALNFAQTPTTTALADRVQRTAIAATLVADGLSNAVQDPNSTLVSTDPTELMSLIDQLQRDGKDVFDHIVTARRDAAIADSRHHQEIVLLTGLLALTMLVALSRSAGQDLRTIAARLRTIAGGDLSPAQPLTGRDELGRISRSVEAMRQSLDDTYASADRNRRRYQGLIEAATDLVLVTDEAGRITFCGPAISRMLGRTAQDCEGRLVRDLVPSDEAARVDSVIKAVLGDHVLTGMVLLSVSHQEGGRRVLESSCRNLLSDDAVGGLVWNARDISERVALEKRLTDMALTDQLTGLPNRAQLRERLRHALLQRDCGDVAVLVVDLDGFKEVNDTYGHIAGDSLLITTAERLIECVRTGDTVARLGGDEFVLVLERVTTPQAAWEVAARVVTAVATRVDLGGPVVSIGASVGLAIGAPGLVNGDDLVHRADEAMYQAKRTGKGRVVAANDEDSSAAARRRTGTLLSSAMQLGRVLVHYQPIAAPGYWWGVEALVRITDEHGELVPPQDFLSAAEETGAIVELGRQVMLRACRDVMALRSCDPALAKLNLTVNLSARQLAEPGLEDDVAEALEGSGLPPEALILDVTGGVEIADGDPALERLQALRNLGVRVALDDVAINHWSLPRLTTLPIDLLKLDRAFVDSLQNEDVKAALLVRSMVSLGATIGLMTLAAGVETMHQASRLIDGGVTALQGYLISRAVSVAELEPLLAQPPLGLTGHAPEIKPVGTVGGTRRR